MELRHLRYFTAVGSLENISRAAARLPVSQPALSRQIRDLEDELGFPLLQRTARSVQLTEAGRVFFDEAKAVLARVDQAVAAARVAAAGQGAELHIGYAQTPTLGLLPQALRLFQERHPGVRVRLHDLATREMDAQGVELRLQIAVTTGSFGLTLERTQLTTYFAQQVLHAGEVALGGVESALGLFLALAELENSGSFLDDRPTLLGASLEDRGDLALADDDVLLATDTGIAEQFLNVEQTARHTVDGVLALSRAEQRAADRDLGELDRQDVVRVVDGERHFGATEGRTLVGAVEDDVVHLLAADGAGRLGAQHPRNGVDHVGLARAVGSHHDGDTGLELHRGGVGEGLEAFEGERLEEHGNERR